MTSGIAVLITTYQAEHTLGRALSSLVAQTVAPSQVIVVDDGSSDNTVSVARQYTNSLNLEILEIGRRGRAIALNRGLAAVRGEYCAILDADDAALPDRLAFQIRIMEQNPSLGALGSSFYQVECHRQRRARVRVMPLSDVEIRRALSYSGPMCHSSVVYRMQAVQEAGGFDLRRRTRIDQDLWIRIAAAGYQLQNLPEPLAVHLKGPATYFARVNGIPTRLTTMLVRNLSAVHNLALPRRYYLLALARAALSLAPQQVVSRFAPGVERALDTSRLPSDERVLLDSFCP